MIETTAAIAEAADSGFRLESVKLDELRADEVLVAVVAVGVCHTDISAAAGIIPFPLPGVLGHEGAGRVIKVGTRVTRVKPGDPVLMTFTSCGCCRACRGGHPAYCDHHIEWNLLGGSRIDGSLPIVRSGAPVHSHFFGQSSFARHAVVDERSLVPLSADTSDDDLATFAPLGCGMQTGAGAVLRVIRPTPDTTLVVSGAGAVGLAAVMAAHAIAVQHIVVIDIVPSRLALATQLGATHTIDARPGNLVSRIRDATAGVGADAAIETTGVVSVLEDLVAATAIRGTTLVIGAPRAGARASFDVNAHLPGRNIVGVTIGDSEPEQFLPELIALYRAGRFPFDALQKRYRFEDIERATADMKAGTVIKPVLVMHDNLLSPNTR